MHPERSFGAGGEAPLGQQFIDERPIPGKVSGQSAQFGNGVLLPFEHKSRSRHVKVEAIAGTKTKSSSDFSRYDEASLLS